MKLHKKYVILQKTQWRELNKTGNLTNKYMWKKVFIQQTSKYNEHVPPAQWKKMLRMEGEKGRARDNVYLKFSKNLDG